MVVSCKRVSSFQTCLVRDYAAPLGHGILMLVLFYFRKARRLYFSFDYN
jgi:hypothetical protein